MPSSQPVEIAQRLGRAPLLGDVGAGGDEVRDLAVAVEQARHVPRHQPRPSAVTQLVLVVARELGRDRRRELGPHRARRDSGGISVSISERPSMSRRGEAGDLLARRG